MSSLLEILDLPIPSWPSLVESASQPRDRLRLYLYAKLWEWARRAGVGVMFATMPLEDGGDECLGLYNDSVVHLAPDHWFDPWTLAHELGHHACRDRPNHSEKTANAAARGIVYCVLGERQALLLDEVVLNLCWSMSVERAARVLCVSVPDLAAGIAVARFPDDFVRASVLAFTVNECRRPRGRGGRRFRSCSKLNVDGAIVLGVDLAGDPSYVAKFEAGIMAGYRAKVRALSSEQHPVLVSAPATASDCVAVLSVEERARVLVEVLRQS